MYKRRRQGWKKHIDFILIDVICLQVAFILAYALRHGNFHIYAVENYQFMAVALIVVDFLVAIMFNSYKNVLRRGYYRELVETVKHVCLVEAVVIAVLFSLKTSAAFSRTVLYIMAAIYVVISYIIRILWKIYVNRSLENSTGRPLLVITNKERIEEIAKAKKKGKYFPYNLAAMIVTDEDLQGGIVCGMNIVANMDNALEYISANNIEEVLIDDNEGAKVEALMEKLLLMGVVVHFSLVQKLDMYGQSKYISKLGNDMVITTCINNASESELFIKRAMDILGALVGCLITIILTIVIGPVIYIMSPGPIFFKQKRVGKHGKTFYLYKFRTMYLDAEERKAELMSQNKMKDDRMFKLDFDPRVIGSKQLPDGTVKEGFGNFLRKTSLDEFPQFFNVLAGSMSLVGTRPPTVDEWEKYEYRHKARLATKPGITGLWQVSGRSNITDFEEVVELDTKYISEWSVGKDIKIILKTIVVLFKRDGAM